MTDATYRQWILEKRPRGPLTPDVFALREVARPTLADGEILLKTVYLSFDPTQRGWATLDTYMPAVPLGEPMRSFGLGQVVESKNRRYPVGQLVSGLVGWQEYAHVTPRASDRLGFTGIPGFLDPELTVALGLTGLTAYFGLLEVGQPKAGETVVVSAAAGATGSIAAQIAKIKGARTIGIAGGPDKCRFLIDDLGLDGAIDYKNENVGERLRALCPKGIDVYFDNVGGPILDAVLQRLAIGARIAVCGSISQYDKLDPEGRPTDIYGVKALPNLTVTRSTMRGFLVSDFVGRAIEGMVMLNRWHDEGRLRQVIDCQQGFENVPATLIRLFEGKNVGKQLLRVGPPPLPVKKSGAAKLGFRLLSSLIGLRKG